MGDLLAPLALLAALCSGSSLVLALHHLARDRKRWMQARLFPDKQDPEPHADPPSSAILLPPQRASFLKGGWFHRLEETPWYQRTRQELWQAGLSLGALSYYVMRLCCAGLLAGGALLWGRAPLVPFLGLLGYFLPRWLVAQRREARAQQINQQLIDALGLLSGAMKAGSGFFQALEQTVQELSPPLSEELRRVVERTRVGSSIEGALLGLAQRVKSYELQLTINAVLIQRQIGGNLAEILDNIAHTLRERIRIQGEVRVLTGEARLSGWILAALPLVLALGLQLLQPEYLAPLLSLPQGRLLLAGAAALELLGLLMIRNIVQLEV